MMDSERPKVEAHILVVDDEPMVAGSVERTLRAHGFQVTVANSGGDGLSAARRHVPDLVVLDVVMPGMDGLEVCRQLRKDPLLGEVPVLFLTARDKREDRVLGLRAGADDYLAKPFDIDELVLRITAILRRRAPRLAAEPPAAQLTVRDLVLDCKAFTVVAPRGGAGRTPVGFDHQ
jgi:DNA-binding response OmpR family regulator